MAIQHFAGSASTKICFAHANGYPPGSYRPLLEALADFASVYTYDHLPLRMPEGPYKGVKWGHFADDYVGQLQRAFDEPVVLLGHSLGGTVSMLTAAQQSHLCSRLILLDPVFIPPKLQLAMRLLPRSKRQQMPMVRKALRRPNFFSDYTEAFQFHRKARAFANFSDDALWGYIHAGFGQHDDGVALRFSREWEAEIYMSAPWVWSKLKRLSTPTLGLVGEQSDVVHEPVVQRWKKTQKGVTIVPMRGGHLFPLESPDAVVPLVKQFSLS